MRDLLRSLITVVTLCYALGASAAQVPLEPSAFASFVVRALTEKGDGSVRVSLAEPLVIRFESSGRVINARLDALHKQCVIQSGLCRDAIKRYVDSCLELVAGAPVKPQAAHLRVLVRDTTYVNQLIDSQRQGGSPPLVMRQYLPDLWMVLAVAGQTVNWIASTDLIQNLGLSEAAAFDVALKNTREATRRLLHVARPLGQSEFSFATGENDSSRLLMHGEWRALAQARSGELLVAVPDTDIIIFGTVDSPDDMGRFKEAAARITSSAANPLSPSIYRWRTDGWEPVADAAAAPQPEAAARPPRAP